MSRRKAIISISPEYIFNLLNIKDNFIYEQANFNFNNQSFEILISNEEFEETEKGSQYPYCMHLLDVMKLKEINVFNKNFEITNKSNEEKLEEKLEEIKNYIKSGEINLYSQKILDIINNDE